MEIYSNRLDTKREFLSVNYIICDKIVILYKKDKAFTSLLRGGGVERLGPTLNRQEIITKVVSRNYQMYGNQKECASCLEKFKLSKFSYLS